MFNFIKASLLGANLAYEAWAKVKSDLNTPHLFENKIDHFNENDKRTFKQRYWFDDQYYSGKESKGPAFLYLCGEWTCSPPVGMYPMMVGADHGAILYSLEHRYFGDSQPFGDWQTKNLEFLTT